MALDWDTANSGLYSRFGRLAGAAADAIALKGGTATARVLSTASIQTRATNMETDAAASPSISDQIDGHWTQIAAFQSAQSGFLQYLKALAEKVLIRQVDLDASLTTRDLTTALREVDRQMIAATETINASTVAIGAQTAVGSPTGTCALVSTIKNLKGNTLQTPFAEAIRFTCTSDVARGATARAEPFTVVGRAAAPDVFSHLWPAGSGGSISLTLCDAQRDNAGGNKLYNSDFETFTTTNYPDNWVIAVGAATTNVLAAGAGYTLSNALRLLGDAGGTLTSLRQTFAGTPTTGAGTGATSGTLLPSTKYAVNGFAKVSSVPAAGVMRFRLVDGSNNVVNDDSATANSFNLTLTALTTSYVKFSGVFVTPAVMPSAIKLEMAMTTAISNTVSVFIDDLALTPMTALYAGGPAFAAFAGDTNPALNDQWTATTTNTMGVLAMWLEKFFGLNAKGITLPYSGSPSNLDTLVA